MVEDGDTLDRVTNDFPKQGNAPGGGEDIFGRVSHDFVENKKDGTRIHYVSVGEGSPLLFVHGWPDFWYTWRHQMAGLCDSYRCVAMDLRGYNESDQPPGVENYSMGKLMGDVDAVIDALGDPVTLVGHDWGGAISWRYAMIFPQRLSKLIISNLTHPRGYTTVLRNATDEQKKHVKYIADFQDPEFHNRLTPEKLVRICAANEPDNVKQRFIQAFEKSSFDSMLNYYRATYKKMVDGPEKDFEPLPLPVLQFHGLQDKAVDKQGLRDTWDWIGGDYTLVTSPKSGHWFHSEEPELVTNTMRSWLANHV